MAWAQPVAPGSNQAIPPAVQGPFVSNPAVVTELDCPGGQCNGPLNFARLMQARVANRETVGNPFNLKVARQIRQTIEDDLNDLANRWASVPTRLAATTIFASSRWRDMRRIRRRTASRRANGRKRNPRCS